jgi:hypothetical protein
MLERVAAQHANYCQHLVIGQFEHLGQHIAGNCPGKCHPLGLWPTKACLQDWNQHQRRGLQQQVGPQIALAEACAKPPPTDGCSGH